MSGQTTFAYTGGNPLSKIDPLGLWSTQAHNAILTTAFPGATPDILAALQAGSANADAMLLGYQGGDYAFMHAMSSGSLSPEESCKKLNEFFSKYLKLYQSNLASANYWSAQGNQALANLAIRDAYFALGFALHPVMDNTSPAHTGFQLWHDSDALRHGTFPTSIEDTNSLTPALLQKTVMNMYRAMGSGNGVACGCTN